MVSFLLNFGGPGGKCFTENEDTILMTLACCQYYYSNWQLTIHFKIEKYKWVDFHVYFLWPHVCVQVSFDEAGRGDDDGFTCFSLYESVKQFAKQIVTKKVYSKVSYNCVTAAGELIQAALHYERKKTCDFECIFLPSTLKAFILDKRKDKTRKIVSQTEKVALNDEKASPIVMFYQSYLNKLGQGYFSTFRSAKWREEVPTYKTLASYCIVMFRGKHNSAQRTLSILLEKNWLEKQGNDYILKESAPAAFKQEYLEQQQQALLFKQKR